MASASSRADSTVVTGKLTSTPLTTFRIEFFANEIPDPSEHGEGEVFLGAKQVTTDAQGLATFSANVSAVAAEKTIAATATDSAGNTSEFSAVVDVSPDPAALQFKVTNTADTGPGSLRFAILSTNVHRGVDRITFNIPGQGPHTIAPAFRLPTITDPVVLDATTEPNYAGTPVVELTGGGADMNGLRITGGRSTVRGLAVNSFQGVGILLESDSNRVQGNYVGTDVAGTHDLVNGVGIKVMGQLNWIGTDGDGRHDAAEGNLISGNLSNVWITQPGDEPGPSPAPAARGPTNSEDAFGRNVVAGNFIGCDVTGQFPLGFVQQFGLLIETGGNRVGTNGDGRSDRLERNVILGSGTNVQLGRGERFFEEVPFDGLRTVGRTPRPSTDDGRGVRPTTLTATSVVSDSRLAPSAVTLDGKNLVLGNIIGTDIHGLPSPDSFSLGIYIRSDGNLVAGNLVSNNPHGNVAIIGNENTVAANLIGTDLSGTRQASDSQFGVDVQGDRNVIGIGQTLPSRWPSLIRRLSMSPEAFFPSGRRQPHFRYLRRHWRQRRRFRERRCRQSHRHRHPRQERPAEYFWRDCWR